LRLGSGKKGTPHVDVDFQRDVDGVDENEYGKPTKIAGRQAQLNPQRGVVNDQRCSAFVVHRPAATAKAATEIFEVIFDARVPSEELCARATELAQVIDATLPAAS
jgi:hypothetical protein